MVFREPGASAKRIARHETLTASAVVRQISCAVQDSQRSPCRRCSVRVRKYWRCPPFPRSSAWSAEPDPVLTQPVFLATESTVFITSTATTSLNIYDVWANKRQLRTDDVLGLYSATGAGARTAAAGATDRQTTCRSCTLPVALALHGRLQLAPHLKVYKTWICEHDFAQNGPPSALDESTTAGPNHVTVTAARRSTSHVEPNRLSHTTETSTQTRHTNGP